MILTHRQLGTALLAAAVAVGCGDGNATGDQPPTALLATTTIWADITSNVGCGAPVDALIPPGADPHTFEPSLRTRQAIEGAALLVANGNDLEGSLVDLLHTAIDDGVNVVEMTPHVDVLDVDDPHADEAQADAHDNESHDDDGHSHGGGDPHIWQDPTRIAGALDVIASALVAAGHDAGEIARCQADYHDRLMVLDAEITAALSAVPSDRRVLVTSHDSLGYFADRYDFEIVGTVIPSSNTLAEASSADLAALADVIDARHVPAIFTEQLESTTDANALAERLEVAIVPLVTDALSDDEATDTYLEMMSANAIAIAKALAP